MDEQWNQKVDELLEGVWKLATAKYGPADTRSLPPKLDQIRRFLAGIEMNLKNPVDAKLGG